MRSPSLPSATSPAQALRNGRGRRVGQARALDGVEGSARLQPLVAGGRRRPQSRARARAAVGQLGADGDALFNNLYVGHLCCCGAGLGEGTGVGVQKERKGDVGLSKGTRRRAERKQQARVGPDQPGRPSRIGQPRPAPVSDSCRPPSRSTVDAEEDVLREVDLEAGLPVLPAAGLRLRTREATWLLRWCAPAARPSCSSTDGPRDRPSTPLPRPSDASTLGLTVRSSCPRSPGPRRIRARCARPSCAKVGCPRAR